MKIAPPSQRSLRPPKPVTPRGQSQAESPVNNEIDFAVLDKSEEALLMPLLDPAFQLALSSCLKDHLSGEPTARTESEIHYQGQFDETKIDQSFELETSEDGSYVSLTGEGELAGETSFDAGTVKKKSGSWWGGYGANTYDLDMIKTFGGYHIWGSLGKLGCRVKVTETAQGLVTEGKIGDRNFRQQITSKDGQHQSNSELQSQERGQKPETSSRSYTSQELNDGRESIEGGGEIFGKSHSSGVSIRDASSTQ